MQVVVTDALAGCLRIQCAAHQRVHQMSWLWALTAPAPAGGGGRSFGGVGGGGGFPGTGANAFPPAGGGYGAPAYGAPTAAPPTHASYTVPGAGEHGVLPCCRRQTTPDETAAKTLLSSFCTLTTSTPHMHPGSTSCRPSWVGSPMQVCSSAHPQGCGSSDL